MTVPIQENQVQDQEKSQKDKEYNFRALEQKYERQLSQERSAREEAERKMQESQARRSQSDDDEEDSDEPYVDHKKLKKKLNMFGQTTQSDIQKAMEIAKHQAKEEIKQEIWLEQNPDFYDTLKNAEKFAQQAPKLAETILRMPEGFERQKLVYQNIKALGMDQPEKPKQSMQDKIDANRRSPYYMPSSMGSPAYDSTSADFSKGGQKAAYDKMQDLKKRLRLG